MSFFSLSSSSSSSPPITEAQYKASLRALPIGMNARRSTRLTRSSGRKYGEQISANEVVSKYFNSVASRPLSFIQIPSRDYYAHLTLTNTGVLTTSTVVNIYAANSFSINDFANSGQYLGLFDQYKILEFEVWIEPIMSQSTAVANVGTFATAVDVDDATAPTSIVAVSGKQNSLSSGALDGHYHRWVPHMAVAAYSGVFTSFSNVPPMWIDSASPTVQHYGLKYAASVTSTAITFELTMKAKVAFRQAGI